MALYPKTLQSKKKSKAKEALQTTKKGGCKKGGCKKGGKKGGKPKK